MDDPARIAARRRAAKTGEHAAGRLVRRAIRELSATEASGLAGDDSVLRTLWDEICVQVQGEHSVSWWAFEEGVRGVLGTLLRDANEATLRALWLATPEGEDWIWDAPPEEGTVPYLADDITELLWQRLYGAAADCDNERIRSYLDR